MFTFSLLRCLGLAFPVQTAEIAKITNFLIFVVYSLKIIVLLISMVLWVYCVTMKPCAKASSIGKISGDIPSVLADREEAVALVS